MNRVLVLSPQRDVARHIRDALPLNCQVDHHPSVQQALGIHNKTPFDLVFSDLQLLTETSESRGFADAASLFRKSNPSVEFVLLTPPEDIRDAVRAIKAGALDYLNYPVNEAEIRMVTASFQETVTRNMELDYLRDQFWKTEWLEIIQSRNPAMRRVFENIRAAAPTIATILLLGETGTGKGLLARLIHVHSNRNDEPFVAVHCGAIPDTLLESELFGHEKGAFTGAMRKKLGKFELTRNGSIFLDEIGTISPAAQVKLLQVLQDGTFSRVGGEEPLKTNARIIAATNADLGELVERGSFRNDLYYRLNVFPIVIPPLRDRREDIPHLIGVFLQQLNDRYGKGITGVHPEVLHAFKTYPWPGNIREVENVLERAYILESGNVLMPQRFPDNLVTSAGSVAVTIPEDGLSLARARQLAIDAFEREYVHNLLARNAGRINPSAAEAEITPRQLNRLMTRYGLNKKDFKA